MFVFGRYQRNYAAACIRQCGVLLTPALAGTYKWSNVIEDKKKQNISFMCMI